MVCVRSVKDCPFEKYFEICVIRTITKLSNRSRKLDVGINDPKYEKNSNSKDSFPSTVKSGKRFFFCSDEAKIMSFVALIDKIMQTFTGNGLKIADYSKLCLIIDEFL